MKNTDTLIKIAAEMSAIAGSCEWAMDQDGGEEEIALGAIDDIRLEDIVTRDWSASLNKLSI